MCTHNPLSEMRYQKWEEEKTQSVDTHTVTCTLITR